MKRIILYTFALILSIITINQTSHATSITIEANDGTWDDNGVTKFCPETEISFNVRYANNSGSHIISMSNGFKIWTIGGSPFTPVTITNINPFLTNYFDVFLAVNDQACDGIGADTIGFGGARALASGLPIGYDEVVFQIYSGGIPEEETICIDSAFFLPSGIWKWITESADIVPTWSGPYCFVAETPPAVTYTTEILIDKVNGGWDDNGITRITPNAEISFDLRYINNSGTNIPSMKNGFKFWTSDGTSFTPVSVEIMHPEIEDYFDLFFGVDSISVDGIGTDTIGINGASSFGGIGLVDEFNEVVLRLKTGRIQEGETLCIDSSYFPIGGTWYWTGTNGPYWSEVGCMSKPKCFVAKVLTGDLSNDGSRDISDLIYLVNYMFKDGSPPVNLSSADINGDTDIDIADLIWLINYMFKDGPPPIG